MRIFKLFFSLGMALHLFACSFWRIKNESSSPVRVRRRACVFGFCQSASSSFCRPVG